MRKSMIKASLLAILLAAWSSGPNSKAAETIVKGVAKAEVFRDNGGGTTLNDLKADPNYPNKPSYVKSIKYAEYPPGDDDGTPPPGDVFNSYGVRISGFITPTEEADYVFYIAADDNAAFYLSTDEDPAHAVQVAYEPQWNPVRNWSETTRRTEAAPENMSAPIHLLKDKVYAWYGLMKEGGGGDNIAIAITKAGDPAPADTDLPMNGDILSASFDFNNIVITAQPSSTAGVDGQKATFSVRSSTPDLTYQWFENGTAIDGATDWSYTVDPITAADKNAKFKVVLTSKDGTKTLTSSEATLSVIGTRQYTKGALRFDFWDGQAAIDPALLGTPIGTYGAGGGTDPDQSGGIEAFDSRAFFPDNSHDNYVGGITGYFIPDQTGTYYFHLKSDDPGQLFLNVDPTDKTKLVADAWPDLVTDSDNDGNADSLVANETGCCNDFQPAGNVRTGGPFTLQQGKKYAMVGLYHEGGGDDYLQVAFTRDGVTTGLDENDLRNFSTIPTKYLEAPAPGVTGPDLALTAQPQSTTVFENRAFSFTVATSGAPTTTLQWQSAPAGSSTFTDIAGATGVKYSGTAPIGMNGTQYRVKAATLDGQAVTSDIATLTVQPDPTPPFVTAANTFFDRTGVQVFFSEPVDAASGTASNYTLDNGATVTSVEVLNSQTVFLHTGAALDASKQYKLTLANIRDLASGGGNVINPTTFNFTTSGAPPAGTFVPGLVTYNRYNGARSVAALRTLIDSGTAPDFTDLLKTFESPVNVLDDAGADFSYGGRLAGWFVPPQTGQYVFYTDSDDNGGLWLSTDSTPANMKQIATETVWSNAREWIISGGSSSLAGKRSDQWTGTQWPSGNAIALVGGQKYYIEELWQEGGGGDDGNATFKLVGESDPATGTPSRITGAVVGIYTDLSNSQPIISGTTPSSPVVFNKGDKITLGVNVSGKAPLTYQWFQNKMAIAGATAATYVINSADVKDIGDYAVKVSNDLGVAWSATPNAQDEEKPGAGDDNLRLIMSNPFLVEAEDYNFGSGKHEAVSDIMPYAGNAYAGLTHAPVLDVDFFNANDESAGGAFAYTRHTADDAGTVEMKGPGDAVDSALGRNRGSFSVTANYGIGWTSVDDPSVAGGDWQNYTRVFPKGKYAVVLGAAHDGVLAEDAGSNLPEINMVLSKVANPTVADGSSVGVEKGDQGLTKLGTFQGNATGAWSSNDLIPLKDAAGNIALIDLDGATTLRLTQWNHDGDEDFLLFYNTETTTSTGHVAIAKAAGGSITITYNATLKSAPAVTGPWTAVAGATSPYTTAATGNAQFFKAE